MKETLERLINNTKGEHLCKYYKEYSQEVQNMIESLYNATYRIGLYNGQILYILDQALEPFKKEK